MAFFFTILILVVSIFKAVLYIYSKCLSLAFITNDDLHDLRFEGMIGPKLIIWFYYSYIRTTYIYHDIIFSCKGVKLWYNFFFYGQNVS